MPRTARVKDIYGIYYINQVGTEDRDLFCNDLDRDKFLSILRSSKKVNDFKLYAYCVSDSNEYHLVICANGSDISKIMKEINIKYAMYVNYSAPIFKDRYRSVLIRDVDHLISILNKIHATEEKCNNKFNSYCLFNDGYICDNSLLDKIDFNSLTETDDCLTEIAECKDCIKTLEEGLDKLNEIADCKGITTEELMTNKSLRNDLIRQFRRNSTLSLKELGEIFGGLSESSICKILNCN